MSIDYFLTRSKKFSKNRLWLTVLFFLFTCFFTLNTALPVPGQEQAPGTAANPQKQDVRNEKIVQGQNLYPPAFDWRNVGGHNFVTSVKDQRDCSSCTAFAVAAALEVNSRILLNLPNKDVEAFSDLSESTLFFCNCSNCSLPLLIEDAIQYCIKTGLGPDTNYYDDILDGCAGDHRSDPCKKKIDDFREKKCNEQGKSFVKILNYVTMTNASRIKQWLATKGPVVFPILVGKDTFDNFKGSGLYKRKEGESTYSHTVCCIGYDDLKGAWLIKNSMGKDWGDNGYFWLPYHKSVGFQRSGLIAYGFDGLKIYREDADTLAPTKEDEHNAGEFHD